MFPKGKTRRDQRTKSRQHDLDRHQIEYTTKSGPSYILQIETKKKTYQIEATNHVAKRIEHVAKRIEHKRRGPPQYLTRRRTITRFLRLELEAQCSPRSGRPHRRGAHSRCPVQRDPTEHGPLENRRRLRDPGHLASSWEHALANNRRAVAA
jgi:hypothetical protein